MPGLELHAPYREDTSAKHKRSQVVPVVHCQQPFH